LPKGTVVLEKIKEKTPKTKKGHYRYRFHQSLTPEIGREELKKVINSVEALASISENKEEFLKLMDKKYSSSQKEVTKEEFDQKLKNLVNAPPINLKEKLKKEKKEQGSKDKEDSE
jgi:hypothetical protein